MGNTFEEFSGKDHVVRIEIVDLKDEVYGGLDFGYDGCVVWI